MSHLIMKNWSPKTVTITSQRVIVGFDIRRPESADSLFVTCYDEKVRYEDINEKLWPELSGMNLFPVEPVDMPLFRLPEGARTVAFDLPEPFVSYVSRGFVSNPQPVPENVSYIKDSWLFCGFDIVDPMRQYSAFHGFGLSEYSLLSIAGSYKINRNSFGLVDDFGDSIALSRKFDNMFYEHAPFMPCGIWLKPDT